LSGYQFTFRIDGDTQFQCNIQSEQCNVIKSNGHRCRRRVCIGSPYCYVHLLYIKHLRIKQSTIPNAGNGLFALNPTAEANSIVFRKTATIIEYDGEVIDDDELVERYDYQTAPYAVKQKRNCNVDCACRRCVASNANTLAGHNNASFSVNNRQNVVKVVATKNIKNGDEIFLSYGKSYKFNENAEHSTRYIRRRK